MTDLEYSRKLAELDRLLNDPDVPMEPAKVWALLDEMSGSETKEAGAANRPAGPRSI